MSLQKYNDAMAGFNALFKKAYASTDGADPIWPRLFTPLKSTGSKEMYRWLGRTGGMGLWVGDRQKQKAFADEFEVPNLPYEDTITFDRFDFEDDQLGGYDLLVTQAGMDARDFPIKLLMKLLAAGKSTSITMRGEKVSIAAWDGKALFASARTIGKDDGQTNLYTGTGVTYDKVIADWQSVRAGMRGLKNGAGETLGRTPSIAVIPPNDDLINSFDTILSGRVPLGSADIRTTLAGYVINDEATGNDWAAFDVNRAVKGLLVQTRQAPKYTAPRFDSDADFERHELVAGIDARWGVAPGDWTCGAYVENSG